jgi:hypothetical protein
MGLESATYISQLVETNPVGATDPKSQGDDHIRLIKAVLKNTFPNINAAVNASDEEINFLVGLTTLVETIKGMGYTSQNAPYSLVTADNGTFIDILTSGTVTLPNLANNFACNLGFPNAGATLSSSSGTLSWYNAAGVALPTGNRTIIRGSVVTVHRVGGAWRCFGSGVS